MSLKKMRGTFFTKSVSILITTAFLLTSINLSLAFGQGQSVADYQKLAPPSIWAPLANEGYAISEQLQYEVLLGTRLLYKKRRDGDLDETIKKVNSILAGLFKAKEYALRHKDWAKDKKGN